MNRAEILEFLREMQKGFKDRRRKPVLRIIYELFNYYVINREIPKYYFTHMLHRNDVKNYLDYYIGRKEFYNIRKLPWDRDLVTFLENKVLFHEHFKGSDLILPNCLGYNLGKEFFSSDGIRDIHDRKSFCHVMEDLMASNGVNSIFLKPISGTGGRDCFKIEAELLKPDILADMYDKISSSKYLFQETIIQHHLISDIYPLSINTLRIHTCINRNGQIEPISCLMKFGSKGKYVEAGGLGTLLISVDMDTGKLGPFAWKNFEWDDEDRYYYHPDTGFEFAGFVLPHFQAAKDMAKAAAAFLPYRLIGWDVVITEKGPMLLEGNHNFGFWAAQIADGGFRKNKVFKSFYDELSSKLNDN